MACEITPGTQPVVIDSAVQFSLTIDSHVQRFRVSQEALEDHFGEPEGVAVDLLEAFERGRDTIANVASRKLGIGGPNIIIVSTFDF
jgi:hypothetical protein